MKAFYLAFLHLRRNSLSSILIVTSVALAVASSGSLIRMSTWVEQRWSHLAEGGQGIIAAKAGSIEILLGALGAEGADREYLPYPLFETLRSQAPIRFSDRTQFSSTNLTGLTPLLYFGEHQGAKLVGTDQSFFDRPHQALSFKEGRPFTSPDEAVLGSQAAASLGLAVGQKLELHLKDSG